MNPLIVRLLLLCLLAPWTFALPGGAAPLAFTTSQAQFAAGDNITIREVLATSSALTPGTIVVVRGSYTLGSRSDARLMVSLTASGPAAPTAPASWTDVTAGSGNFELEFAITLNGTLHVTFYGKTGNGASFGGIYFAAADGGTVPPPTTVTPPATVTPPINTNGLISVPFGTSRASFESGDIITLSEVLASSPRLEPGDTVVVRGTYRLQSQSQALLAISLTTNAPGVSEIMAPAARKTVDAGTGTFELAYEVRQPGALHVTFYPAGAGGSSFGGIYFAPPSGTSGNSGNTVAILNPNANTGRLGNLSIRSLVGPGEGALIAGISVTDQERYVVIRAVGPSLAAFGLTGVLGKPVLSVYSAAGELIATTGSWSTAYTGNQRAGIQLLMSSVGAFPLTVGGDDAVLNLRLVPGGYTVQVTTGDGQSGVAMLEVYSSATYSLPPQ
jgi:hypothetical protein